MARDAATYRGARRNFCIREQKMVWGPEWYYSRHDNSGAYRGARVVVADARAARYVPAKRVERKRATTSNVVHQLLKQGRYAEAVRTFFAPRVERGSARGS